MWWNEFPFASFIGQEVLYWCHLWCRLKHFVDCMKFVGSTLKVGTIVWTNGPWFPSTCNESSIYFVDPVSMWVQYKNLSIGRTHLLLRWGRLWPSSTFLTKKWLHKATILVWLIVSVVPPSMWNTEVHNMSCCYCLWRAFRGSLHKLVHFCHKIHVVEYWQHWGRETSRLS